MKKKLIVGATALILSGAVIFTLTGAASGKDSSAAVRTTALEKSTLAKTVSATGTVYSQKSTEVYSNLSYPVKTVYVEAGDKVSEGDVLAELDISGLESDIAQKKASVGAAQATANQNLASANSDLATYKRNAENGNDNNLVNAESAVTSAELDVQNAELDVQSAELDIQSANTNLRAARRDLRDARDDGADDSELDKLRDQVRSCETSVEKAETNLEKSKSNLEKSKTNLDKANVSNETAKVSSTDTLTTYQNKVKSAQLGTNFNDQWISIQKMEGDLEKAVITAPVSGTVTAVYAVEGGSGNGRLFVIQETDSLKVVTNIKEYDIDIVSIGDKVAIKADATGDQVFDGTLAKIAPTSTQTAAGSTQNGTDAEYESEVSVSSAKGGLKIGMNARLSIITQEKKGIYAVPYESVGTNKSGESVVFIASPQEGGSYIAQAVTVETGMETDLYVEISAKSLTDGMLVIKNISGIQDGMLVTVGS